MEVEAAEWDGPWSIRRYVRFLQEEIGIKREFESFSLPGGSLGKYDIVIHIGPIDNEKTLAESVEPARLRLAAAVDVVDRAMVADIEKRAVITYFEFPDEVSTACEQYLLYFVQFLKDLGIEAQASIKHHAHEVLFSVTPLDETQALDAIRAALDAYIQIPSNPEFATEARQQSDIAVQQLHAQVLHLQSQLMLSGAVLQASQATIQALQFTNYQLQQQLSEPSRIRSIGSGGQDETTPEPISPEFLKPE